MGVFSKNREEWAVVDLACMGSSVTIVPFFDSLGPQALNYVINQTEVSTMCIEQSAIKTFIDLKNKDDCRSLKNLVCFDKITEEQRE